MMRYPVKNHEAAAPPSPASAKEDEWEVRPGGLLVQKRASAAADQQVIKPPPPILVRVKHNGVYHEVFISPHASFGELKKMMSARTGLHPADQQLLFKGRERDSKAFLDTAGVKNQSKMALQEDPTAKAKRLVEERRADKMEKTAMAVSRISLDVDKLAAKVSALEAVVKDGGKVSDGDVVLLTEALMNELLRLDAIPADGDVLSQRRIQEKRLQKYVEALDAIRIKNATSPPPLPPPLTQQHNPPVKQQQHPLSRRQIPAAAPPAASDTGLQNKQKWETFDLLSSIPSTSSAASTTTMSLLAMSTTMTAPSVVTAAPRFDWELF